MSLMLKKSWLRFAFAATSSFVALSLVGCGAQGDSDLDTKVCATGELSHGVDVSKYQGDIDWKAVSGDGIKFAYIRVSDGLKYKDAKFDQNWTNIKETNMRRGAYQFFRPKEDAVAQAKMLVEKVGGMEKGDLPPVIDVESADGLDSTAIVGKVRQWIEHVENGLGIKPIIYAGKFFWQDNVKSTEFKDYALWLPSYFRKGYEKVCPNTPDQWSNWKFWQWTDQGKVKGIQGNVDRNVFNGPMNDLEAMTFGATTPKVANK